MSNTITMPPMIGTREAAVELINESEVDADLQGERVVIYSNALLSATPSFVSGLLNELVNRHVETVALVGAPSKFVNDLRANGSKLNFDKIITLKAVDL
jgi:phage FluMu protein gp41